MIDQAFVNVELRSVVSYDEFKWHYLQYSGIDLLKMNFLATGNAYCMNCSILLRCLWQVASC